MIKGITAGEILQVDGGTPHAQYVNYSNQPLIGMVRYYNSNLEVYDGSMWQQISSSYANIKLDYNATEAIKWALKNMQKEAEIKKLAADHPAVQIAMDNLEKARLQLEATIILSKEHEQPTS